MMIIVRIVGGLGNQMFQYAYAKALERQGKEVKIDISAYATYKLHGGYQLGKYNIDLKSSTTKENSSYYSNSLVRRLLRKFGIDNVNIKKEENLLYNKHFLDIEDNKYVSGYFQSEKYFRSIRKQLLKQFVIKEEVSKYTQSIKRKILKSDESCSIHIRRGDFLNKTNLNIHGACDAIYYENALKLMDKGISYFIFSDDISWVKENLNIENATYVDSIELRIPHEDIYLMSLCSHNIIANSSFSWWGAWLNENSEKIVIAPKRWFVDEKLFLQSKDIVCEGWIQI